MYTDAKGFLGKTVTIVMDRPLGSKHPKHGYVYPVNYGFVPETKSPDGGELDAYILGVDVPLEEFLGRCIAVIHRLNDDDDKLIVVPDGQSMTDDEIRKAVYFQEQYFKSEMIRNETSKNSLINFMKPCLNNYDLFAEKYRETDLKPDKRFSILPTVLQAVGDLSGKTVLDLGCGSGFFTRAFADVGASDVIGVDRSTAQIDLAKKEPRSNVKYLVEDVFKTSLPKSDIVCAPFLINYFPSKDELILFLKKIKNALREDGKAIFIIDLPSGRDLKKYGSRKTVHGPYEDGSPMTLELFDGNENLICILKAYFIAQLSFETSLKEAGFTLVQKLAPVVSEEGLNTYGEAYWRPYLIDTELGYYLCLT